MCGDDISPIIFQKQTSHPLAVVVGRGTTIWIEEKCIVFVYEIDLWIRFQATL